jgi:HAD superfamily hydrolase (TIGR01549 family)
MSLVILIDLDDTLTDRSAAFDAWAVPFLVTHARPATELARLRELDRRGLRPRDEFLRLTLQHLALDLDVRTELATYRAKTGAPPLQYGVRDRLAAIRGHGGTIVVLTNGVSAVQRRKLRATGLMRVVDDVIVSEEVELAKPDPRIYGVALLRVGASAVEDQVWMVGDNPDTDVRGALEAGLHAAWVNPLRKTWKGRPKPDLDLPSTAECLDRIAGTRLLPVPEGIGR